MCVGGERAGAMGTSGLCLKSCKRFGVENAHGKNLWANIGSLGKEWGGSGLRLHFVVQKRIFVGKEKCIITQAVSNLQYLDDINCQNINI